MSPLKTTLALLTLVACVDRVHAQFGFVETFSGTGPFSSTGDVLDGFDAPGWEYQGTNGMFRDGGLWVSSPEAESVRDSLEHSAVWSRGFVHTLEIREHMLPQKELRASIVLWHFFKPSSPELEHLRFETLSSKEPDKYTIALQSEGIVEILSVDRGPHIRMSIAFDASKSQASYGYDNNLDDDVPPITLATLPYSLEPNEDSTTFLSIGHSRNVQADALIDNWVFSPFSFTGDFNANAVFDAEDIDLLNAEIRRGTNDHDFDLVEDGLVDEFDRTHWVHSLNNTFYGDSNLDGEFKSADLVAVFQAGHYEDGIAVNSGWAEGDWNGNGDFESGDLIVAFQDGGYELGPRAASAVPEPCGILLVMICLWVVPSARRKPVDI